MSISWAMQRGGGGAEVATFLHNYKWYGWPLKNNLWRTHQHRLRSVDRVDGRRRKYKTLHLSKPVWEGHTAESAPHYFPLFSHYKAINALIFFILIFRRIINDIPKNIKSYLSHQRVKNLFLSGSESDAILLLNLTPEVSVLYAGFFLLLLKKTHLITSRPILAWALCDQSGSFVASIYTEY